MLEFKPKGVNALWIVSASGFSREAEEIASKRPDEIKLINGKKIIAEKYRAEEKIAQIRLKPFVVAQRETEIDFAQLSKWWVKVRDAKTNKEKKESLEGLGTFLFSSIKNIKVQKNLRMSAEEIDLLLQNESGKLFLAPN